MVLYLLSLFCWITFAQGGIAREWSLIVNVGYLAGIAALIFSATRSDSVVDSSAWWATRPIDPRSLFLSKLLLWGIAIALPLCLCTGALALKFQLNVSQTLLVILEMILITATVAGFVAVASSVTHSAQAGGLITIPLVMLLFLGTMFSFQARSYYNNTSHAPLPSPEKSLALGMCLLTLLAVGNWGLRIIRRGKGGSYPVVCIGLLAFLFYALVNRQDLYRKFALPDSEKGRIQMTVLDNPHIHISAKQPSQLYSHFAFSGLKPDEFVALDWINAKFEREDEITGSVLEYGSMPGSSPHRFDHDILSQLQPLLLKQFPANTSWSSEWNARRTQMIPIGYPRQEVQSNPETRGHFSGKLQAHILELTPLEKIPLRTGVYALDSGRSLDVHAILPQWNSIRVELALTRPRLALSKDPESNLISPYAEEETRYLFVIYRPSSNESFLLENKHPARRNPHRTLIPLTQQPLAFNIPFSSLQSAINNLSMTDWLAEAEIRTFKINTVGTQAYQFSKPNYHPYLESFGPAENEAWIDDSEIENITLPENPSEEDVSVFVKSLLDRIPDRYRQDYVISIRKKIASLGSENIPVLLRHLPNDEGLVNTYIRPAINKMIQAQHLPAFKELWSRSDLFINEVRRHRWADKVRDTMKARITERRQISPTVIALAAGSRDPATYKDLRWHFINSRWGHEIMLREMKQCDGLELPTLIDQAWSRARLNLASVDGLAIPAAVLGLPDALRQAYLHLLKHEGDARTQKREQLREIIAYQGPDEKFEAWLLKHLTELRFDKSDKVYRLASESPKP